MSNFDLNEVVWTADKEKFFLTVLQQFVTMN